jgi:hypothetical protein
MEIEQREQQQSQLLNISTHIATIRDKKDLFRLIARDMKAFIDFDDVEIAIINEEKQSFSFFSFRWRKSPGKREWLQPQLSIEKDNPFLINNS